MSKYVEIRRKPPILTVKANAREIIFTTISVMCDNIHYLTLKKDSNGDFKMSGGGFSLSNWQIKHPIHDIEWKADEEKWSDVIDMINTGTEVISEVKSR